MSNYDTLSVSYYVQFCQFLGRHGKFGPNRTDARPGRVPVEDESERRWNGMKRVVCALLAMVMVISLLPGAFFVANAASKQEKTRAIGIVFDNSGSMYDYGDQAWCRATYAMEVFASMMNDGDVMQIYPMSPINLDGSTREEYTEDKPLVIRGPGEAQTIRSICTPLAQTTPISTITAAYEGLKKTQADERWLIVLTDGSVFYPNNTTSVGRPPPS